MSAAETIPGALLSALDDRAERRRIHWREGGTWRSMGMPQVVEEIASIARGLEALGAGPGVPLAILASTRREWTAVDLASLCLGGVTVGIYPSLLPDQIAYQLAHSEAVIAVVEDAAQAEKLQQVRARLPALRAVLSMEPVPGLETVASLTGRGDVDWLRRRAARVAPGDVATIIYTSGTTGDPKGAVLTHDNFIQVARASREVVPTRPGDRSLFFLPLAHSLQRFAVYRGLLEEGEAFYTTIDELPEALLYARPQVLASVPRMLEKIRSRATARVAARGGAVKALFDWAFRVGLERSRLLERGEPVPPGLALRYRLADRLVFSRVRERLGGQLRCLISGGAALHPEVARWFHALGVSVLEGWGLTETSAPATANREHDFKLGTVGKPLPGVALRIAEDGEILVRGPGVFRGYYKDPQATERALDSGWFRTGDIGRIDEDGFLIITDRKKEILVTAGGKNIAPLPLETRLERSDLVEKAVVIGSERPYLVALLSPDVENLQARADRRGWPDEPLEVRLARPEVRALFDEALAHANRGLPRFEQIKKIRVLPTTFTEQSGELTPTLKLKRRVIASRYADEIEALYRG